MASTYQSKKHILLVDDEESTRDVLTMMLEREGHTVSGAANGREALDYLRGEARPHLILLDLTMPIMCGREFRKCQKQDPALASIPVVVVSAAAEVGQEAVALSAAAYIRKPIEMSHLLATIRRVCSQGFAEAVCESSKDESLQARAHPSTIRRS